ncbi:MAG: hypothetical protein EKK37_11490 [Sphingobacteriales bacterium]|nr:MAG: hypothetical protein EKK37_11490 [Sphingobacteriales bacterium]
MSFKFIYSFVSIVLLISCNNYYTYNEFQHKPSITDIPLKQVKDKVDLYFNNERPAQPFYKVKIVEVIGRPYTSYNEMLAQLKQNALEEGMDGIIYLDSKQETGYADVSETIYLKDTSTSISRQVANPYQRMTGIGLKYISTINYLDSIVKKSTIKLYGNNVPNDSFIINFDWHGNVLNDYVSAAFQKYYQQVLPYDIIKAYEAWGKGWSVSTDPETNKLVSKRFQLNNFDIIHYQYYYTPNGLIDYAKVKTDMPSVTTNMGSVYLNFDRRGLLNEKKLVLKKSLIWREKFVYDEKDRCTKIIRTAGNSDRILLTIENKFFSNSDLPVAEK